MFIRTKEVLTKFVLTVDTLRYWEKVKVIPKIDKDSSGYRNYREDDLHWIDFAICMRNAGVQLNYLIQYRKLFEQGNNTLVERKSLLIDQFEDIKYKKIEIDNAYKMLQKN